MFDCQICNKTFARSTDLNRHNNSKKHIKLQAQQLLEKQDVETKLIHQEEKPDDKPKDWREINWKFTILPTLTVPYEEPEDDENEEELEQEPEEELSLTDSTESYY